jgi:hypothetical protein
MNRRTPRPRDTRSPWLIGIAEIAGYAQLAERTVNTALLSGELDGRQRRAGGTWRSRVEWVDTWIEGFGSAPSRERGRAS